MTLNHLLALAFALIVRVGDSNTLIASTLYPRYEYYAVNGWSAKAAADDPVFADYIYSKENALFIVGLGTNDHWDSMTYERDMRLIAENILRCGNRVMFLKIPNMEGRTQQIAMMNSMLLNVAAQVKARFINFESHDSDGLHYSKTVHERIEAAIENELR